MNEEKKALEALDKLYDENSEGMKQLAEHERIKVIQTACGAIRKYSDSLKALAEEDKQLIVALTVAVLVVCVMMIVVLIFV